MIHYNDVARHLQALNPQTSNEEINTTYQRMLQACITQTEALTHQMREQWETLLGTPPNPMEWEQINRRAQITAANLVYQDFLAPITEGIINQQLMDEDEEIIQNQMELLNNPTSWITDPYLIDVEPWINDLTIKIWPDASPRWLMYDATYCQRQYHLQLPLPTIDNPKINSILEAEITAHLRAHHVDAPETR